MSVHPYKPQAHQEPTTVGELVEEWSAKKLKRVEGHKFRERRQRANNNVLRRFAKVTGKETKVRDIDEDKIMSFVKHERARGVEEDSIRCYLTRLGGMFHYGKRTKPELRDWVIPEVAIPKQSPIKRTYVLSETDLAKPRDYLTNPRPMRYEQANSIRARRTAYDLLVIGLQTGMRVSEMLALEWE
jgi:site-specific recombinase XerD